jgi:hypothetical protein
VFVFLDSEEIMKFQSNCGRQSEEYRKCELKIKENMCWIYPQFGRQAPDPGGGMEHLVIDRTHLPLCVVLGRIGGYAYVGVDLYEVSKSKSLTPCDQGYY